MTKDKDLKTLANEKIEKLVKENSKKELATLLVHTTIAFNLVKEAIPVLRLNADCQKIVDIAKKLDNWKETKENSEVTFDE